jgi:hypothetical protein
MGEPTADEAESTRSRVAGALPGAHPRRGAVAVCVFLTLGFVNVALLLLSGSLWGLAVLPPVLFCGVLVWVVFGTDFLEGRS